MSETRRTQLYLEPSLYDALRQEAFVTRKTISACVRGILARHFKQAPKKNATELLLRMSGIAKGLPPDLSERHDDYLYEDMEAELREKGRRYDEMLRKRRHENLR